MSRIGKKPVVVPKGVTANMDGKMLKAKGPKGELAFDVNEGRYPTLSIEMKDGEVAVARRDETRRARRRAGPRARHRAEHDDRRV